MKLNCQGYALRVECMHNISTRPVFHRSKMIAIGRCFVFMISVTATMSSPQKINEAEMKPFLQRILNLHNQYRSKHGAKPLLIDDKLSKDADDILNKFYEKKLKLIPKDIGMNMSEPQTTEDSNLGDANAEKLFLEWYNTGAGYDDYDNEPSKEIAKNAAPFTQIVWKNTKKLGLAMALYNDVTFYVVATYQPKGNKKKNYVRYVSKRNDQ